MTGTSSTFRSGIYLKMSSNIKKKIKIFQIFIFENFFTKSSDEYLLNTPQETFLAILLIMFPESFQARLPRILSEMPLIFFSRIPSHFLSKTPQTLNIPGIPSRSSSRSWDFFWKMLREVNQIFLPEIIFFIDLSSTFS